MTEVISSRSYFDIFSLPVGWIIERPTVDARYRQLQQEFHPDRYAAKGDVEKRLAVQTAALINDAYQTLISPLKRAQYLMQLDGIDADQESHITSDGAFLMSQIDLREELADIGQDGPSPAALEALASLEQRVGATYVGLQDEFSAHYSAGDQAAAFDTVAKMQFFVKLLDQVEALEEQLDS